MRSLACSSASWHRAPMPRLGELIPGRDHLIRAEKEDRRTTAFSADDLEAAADARRPLPHPHQAIATSACREATTFIRDLDQERVRGESHPDPADRRARVT